MSGRCLQAVADTTQSNGFHRSANGSRFEPCNRQRTRQIEIVAFRGGA